MDVVALPFVIPSEAEGSAVQRTYRGNVFPTSWSLQNSLDKPLSREPLGDKIRINRDRLN
jgi:hypothetical protein